MRLVSVGNVSPIAMLSEKPTVSQSFSYEAAIIVPTFNVEEYIADALESVLAQTGVELSTLQLVLYDDTSTDATLEKALALMPRLEAGLGSAKVVRGADGPLGCGAARNRAVEATLSRVLIFLDGDDIMSRDRVARTLASFPLEDASPDRTGLQTEGGVVGVIGGNFERFPRGSTPRYQAYHDSLSGSTAQ
jgi:glycosyltransferase involved in cell wall biosynthesis